MKPSTGTIIKKSDLKLEGDNYTFFLQLIDLRTKAGLPATVDYKPSLLDKWDQIVITQDDDIKGPNSEAIDNIPGASQLAQQLYTSG